MALRASTSASSSSSSSTNSLLVGLPLFWHEASNSSSMEWEKWIDLFAVAMMAKHSISMNEWIRTADEVDPKVKALGDMPEEAANKKAVSMMFLSLGKLVGKCSAINIQRKQFGPYKQRKCYRASRGA